MLYSPLLRLASLPTPTNSVQGTTQDLRSQRTLVSTPPYRTDLLTLLLPYHSPAASSRSAVSFLLYPSTVIVAELRASCAARQYFSSSAHHDYTLVARKRTRAIILYMIIVTQPTCVPPTLSTPSTVTSIHRISATIGFSYRQ